MKPETQKLAEHYVMNTYSRFPLVLTKGKGSYVYDDQEKKYLDFSAGIAVNCLGHADEGLLAVIADQSQRLMHTSNLFWNEPQIHLAKALVEKSGLDQAFFCNSGAEANEAALKLARIYAKLNKDKHATQIIAMEESFHGRTYGAISLTGQKKYQKNLDPLVEDIIHVPYNDFNALLNQINERTAAILLEPIQGESGVHPADQTYLQKVRELCDEQNIVLIFDEVQTGIGRCGEFFAFQTYGVTPDVICLAKGLGGGFPIGAIVAKQPFARALTPGTHAATFGGNPLACAIGNYIVKTVGDEVFLKDVKSKSDFLISGLNTLKTKYPDKIAEVRGKGLLIAVELNQKALEILSTCIDKGLLLVGAGEKNIRFLPPLNCKRNEIREALEIFEKSLLL